MNIRKCKSCGSIQDVKNKKTCFVCGSRITGALAVPSTSKNIKEAEVFQLIEEVFEHIDQNREDYEFVSKIWRKT